MRGEEEMAECEASCMTTKPIAMWTWPAINAMAHRYVRDAYSAARKAYRKQLAHRATRRLALTHHHGVARTPFGRAARTR